jgi:hypothetical protein
VSRGVRGNALVRPLSDTERNGQSCSASMRITECWRDLPTPWQRNLFLKDGPRQVPPRALFYIQPIPISIALRVESRAECSGLFLPL